MSYSRSGMARKHLKDELVKYVQADKQLQLLSQQCNECRKIKRNSQEKLFEIGKILNLEGRTLNYQMDTVSFSYEQPRVGLSQALLRSSLNEYLCQSNRWRSQNIDVTIDLSSFVSIYVSFYVRIYL